MSKILSKALAVYGLTHNPFLPDTPTEGFFLSAPVKQFLWRVEKLAGPGGFALIHSNEPGEGKSVLLRLLRDRLGRMSDVHIGVLTRPHCSVADLYRELGDIYQVPLKPHNRWLGSKGLRACWQAHIDAALTRPVLLIDEAQETTPAVFNELRLLSSSGLDSQALLTVVLAGDDRLLDKFLTTALAPLYSRIRIRIKLDPLGPDQLREYLQHMLREAGNPSLMTPGLIDTLCERACGNLRTLTHMCIDLLEAGAERDGGQLDEGLFLELFDTPDSTAAPTASDRPNKRRRKAR